MVRFKVSPTGVPSRSTLTDPGIWTLESLVARRVYPSGFEHREPCTSKVPTKPAGWEDYLGSSSSERPNSLWRCRMGCCCTVVDG